MSDRPGPLDQSEERALVRRSARASRRSIASEVRRQYSQDICAHIVASRVWQTAGTITIYVPMEFEVDVWPLLNVAWASGRRMAIPRIVDREHGIMTFDWLAGGSDRRADDTRADELKTGVFGIPMARDADEAGSGEIDLVLVPATAVDVDGNRLGGGAGYYDRWLEGARSGATKRPFALGVVFGRQVVAAGSFVVEAHDQPLDAWVTEQGISTADAVNDA